MRGDSMANAFPKTHQARSGTIADNITLEATAEGTTTGHTWVYLTTQTSP